MTFGWMAINDQLAELGNKFKAARIEKGMSQEDLAYKIGKDQPSINRLEKGNINPSYLYMLEVCKGLELSVDQLLTRY